MSGNAQWQRQVASRQLCYWGGGPCVGPHRSSLSGQQHGPSWLGAVCRDWRNTTGVEGVVPHVRGYYRADGTWVSPHWRSDSAGHYEDLALDGDGATALLFWIICLTPLTLLFVGLGWSAHADYFGAALLCGAADAGCVLMLRRRWRLQRAEETARIRREIQQALNDARRRREAPSTGPRFVLSPHADRISELLQWQTPDGRPGPYGPTARPRRPTCTRCGTQKYGHPGAEICFWCGA